MLSDDLSWARIGGGNVRSISEAPEAARRLPVGATRVTSYAWDAGNEKFLGVPYAWSWRWRTKMRTWHMEWLGEISTDLERFEGSATTKTSMKIGMICIYSYIYRWSTLVNVGLLKVGRQNLANGKNQIYGDFYRNFNGISIYGLNTEILSKKY